jgi:outer membrane protein/protease secretion system outer membrane protein
MRVLRVPARPKVLLSGVKACRAACLAAVLGIAAPQAWAMDMLQAFEAALAKDATVRAARAAADAARETLPQARAQLLPSISLSVGRNRNDLTRTQPGPTGRPVTTDQDYFSYNQTLQLRQPLYRKSLMAGLEQARHVVDEAEAVLEQTLQDLGARVAGAYLDVLFAGDQLELVRQQRRVLEVQLDAAQKALKAGSGIRTDIDEARARLDLNRADELQARQNLDYTRRQLEILTGEPVGDLAGVDADRMPLLPPDPAGIQDWVALAEAASPEIDALRARTEAARVEVQKASGGHYPTLDAVASYNRSGSENVTSTDTRYKNWVLGLQLNVPIYQGGGISSRVRQTLAEATRAEELLEAARRDLSLRLHREYRGVTEGVLRVEALEEAVRSAEQLVHSYRRSFQAGSRTLVDIMNAEQSLQIARRDLAEARYQYLASRVRLNVLAGNDRRLAIQEINGWLARR